MIMPVFSVRDVEASTEYYCARLGFSVASSSAGIDGRFTKAVVEFDGRCAIGLERGNGVSICGVGVVCMVTLPTSVDLATHYERCRERGAAIERELGFEIWGTQCFVVRDPDGYVLKFSDRMSLDHDWSPVCESAVGQVG